MRGTSTLCTVDDDIPSRFAEVTGSVNTSTNFCRRAFALSMLLGVGVTVIRAKVRPSSASGIVSTLVDDTFTITATLLLRSCLY